MRRQIFKIMTEKDVKISYDHEVIRKSFSYNKI